MRRIRAAAVLFVIVLTTGAAATDQATWDLAGMKDPSLENWSQPTRERLRSYRVAAGGKPASLTVPAWWGKGLRPEEGKIYDLKITYRDDATQPVVFLSHAGVGKYYAPVEVHRFGGSGDGKWKSAIVPVSWDLVARINVPFQGLTDEARFVIESNKDLPVATIEVGPAARDARQRYDRETRKWIARAGRQNQTRRPRTQAGADHPRVDEGPGAGAVRSHVPGVPHAQ